MKSRHLRAIAVFGIAVIALTGARGSSGGGCSGDSSSSSSSSSGGGSDSSGGVGKDDSGSDSGTTTTSGGTTTSGTSGSSSSKRAAAKDLKIESCTYDNGLVARVRATNSSSTTTYSYKFDVEFTDTNGKLITTAEDGGILSVPAGEFDTLDVKAPENAADGSGFSVGGGSCKLTDTDRFAE